MGKIILLNTPIGNLGDLTPRVLEALTTGTLFAVEDTRVFRDLLSHLGISIQGKRVMAFHDQSDPEQVKKLIEFAQGEDLYVTSDAGSPIISDPAYPLVAAAVEEGLRIESYSGVSSPIMALELSGLPPMPFHFHGFLPRENSRKSKAFRELEGGTHIFFDAPTRIEETLEVLAEVLPESRVAVVRELSKKFEEVLRFEAKARPAITAKGEFILLVHQAKAKGRELGEITEMAQEILDKGAAPKLLAKLLGAILEKPTKDIYAHLGRRKEDG